MRSVFKLIFFCAVLSIFAGRASASTCPVDGPDLNTTGTYITDAMRNSGVSEFKIYYYTDTSEIAYRTGRNDEYDRVTSSYIHHDDQVRGVNTLNCADYGVQPSGSSYFVYVRGINGRGGDDALSLLYSGDVEHANRLATALAHFVYLKQQEWKQAHDDPNDPFKNPSN